MEHVWNESPILLLAMYASACRYRHALKQSQTEDPEVHAQLVAEDFEEGTRYYKQARIKIDRFLDVPCLQTILALRLLGNFAISVGEGTSQTHLKSLHLSNSRKQATLLASFLEWQSQWPKT
jgi:hypothetical protein